MKNLPAIFSVLLLVFSACSEKKPLPENPQETKSVTPAKDIFANDSVWVDDSLKLGENVMAKFKIKSLVFANITDKTLLDSIYATQNIKAEDYSKKGLLAALESQKTEFYEGTKESLKDWSPEFPQTWEQNSAMKLFSKSDDFLTVQYTSDGYTGGAHGYYNELYKVFDIKTNKTLQLADVIKDQDATIWGRILMAHFLKNDLERNQAQMLLVKQIPLNTNFYFDAENLYFLYNQYEIAAYAAGPVLIQIPFTEIKPLLDPAFRQRLNLN